jgi:hypothetical protein
MGSACPASTLEGIALLNATNLARYFNGLLQYLYDSHGCLHFTPADILLLSKTIPAGTELEIKRYSETKPPFDIKEIPFFADTVNSPQDITNYRETFLTNKTKLLVYPALNRLFIIVNGQPYLQVRVQPGPAKPYILAFNVERNGPIDWDNTTMTPTDPGRYKTLASPPHYHSNLYSRTTLIPFGATLAKRGQNWYFQDEGRWRRAPGYVAFDLSLPAGERHFNYYDEIPGVSARWGSHDFGIDTLLWSKDGRNRYPELGYAEGELLFARVLLVQDLAQMLTRPDTDDFDACVSGNENFKAYRDIYEFIQSGGQDNSESIQQEPARYYLLLHRLPLLSTVKEEIDSRILRAFADPNKDQRELGLYEYALDYVQVFEEKAHWYGQFKSDWPFWRDLKIKLREDFNKLKIDDPRRQEKLLENWLNQRLRFNLVYDTIAGEK